ncbi:MAG TPA: tripartite tricarboxylate transporter substrate binding protein [Ramlibacter sp.]|uniref:Bug family tripartite tricarboxylate transporter substrate binding protein n=1 Tax=Ramlibacter sp. TaxID=1917967 RepID=UPI002C1BA084|nr:tripartite tricarboxylate transporter substrate binding protein [Ramlibacter sp.]HVZ46503.1 tripartite tricarboxylate transporter substrate binding protein [Ramlibacter sp.]
MLSRRSLICALPAAALASTSALAQQNVMHIVVPFAPGASTDMLARMVGQKVADKVGKVLVVDNKSGAGGQIGLQYVAKAPADGNTLLLTPSGPMVITAHLMKVPYDPIKDLTPVAMVAYVPTAIAVNADTPYKSLQELLAAAKDSGKPINYSVSARGTHMHLSGELLRRLTATNFTPIPYRGAAPAATAVAGGEVPMTISDLNTLLPLARSGRIRILAVTGSQRTKSAPDIPTVSELGIKGYSADAWIGMFAPAGTPEALVSRLNEETSRVLALPEVVAALQGAGLETMPMTVAQMQSFVTKDSDKWAELVRDAKIKVEQ